MIHITTLIGATFLKQQRAQKKIVEPSVGSSKRPRVQSTAGNVHAEKSPLDPTTTIVDNDDDEVHVDIAAVEPTVPPPLSLSSCYDGDFYNDSSSSWIAFKWAYF